VVGHCDSVKNKEKTNHMSESIVKMLLELQKAQCRDHCPREPVLVPDHSVVKNLFLNPHPDLS